MNEDQEFIEYEKFAERMEKSYPKMFTMQYGGFAVGKGWYPILEQLCKNIQQHIEFANKHEDVCPQVVVEQIKEKFGSLRFYFECSEDHAREHIQEIVSKYEAMSSTINRRNENE